MTRSYCPVVGRGSLVGLPGSLYSIYVYGHR